MLAWCVESLVQEGSSLLHCQAFLWSSRCPYRPTCHDYQAGAQSPWTYAAWYNHPMWDGAGFSLSLFGGKEASGAVCLALVEKI
jgi:hypothetical protein